MFNYLIHHFITNKLFKSFQSGFSPDDSFTSQSQSIVHEINLSFGFSPGIDVRGVF